MGYVLGVDGDNTYTRYFLFTDAGECAGYLLDSTCSQEVVGFDGATGILKARVHQLLAPRRVPLSAVRAAAFGLAGVDTMRQQRQFEAFFRDMGLARCGATNDTFLGVLCGTSRGVGVCSLNAVGCATGGIDERGQWLQVGGLGPTTGDDGGGGYIAEMCLRKVYDAYFRCGQETLMAAPVFAQMRIASPDEMADAIIDGRDADAPDFIRILFAAAELDDGPALEVLAHIGRELARSAAGCIRRLTFDREIEVALAGGIWRKAENPLLFQFFERELRLLCPQPLKLNLLKTPLAAGAVMWALALAGVDPYQPSMRRAVAEGVTRAIADDVGEWYDR